MSLEFVQSSQDHEMFKIIRNSYSKQDTQAPSEPGDRPMNKYHRHPTPTLFTAIMNTINTTLHHHRTHCAPNKYNLPKQTDTEIMIKQQWSETRKTSIYLHEYTTLSTT